MAITKTYTAKWADGWRTSANAEKVAGEIMSIGDDVTPKQVVNYAKDPCAELHKCFEWDDLKAADAYRIFQARNIMNHLVIEVPDKKDEQESSGKEIKYQIRFFQKTSDNEGYKPATVFLQNPDEYKLLLQRAKAELKSFQNKYRCLTELSEIFELIDQL